MTEKGGAILPTKPIEGVFGKIKLLDNNTKLQKSYIEDRSGMNIPFLFSASNKIYLYENITEHQAHEALSKHFPSEYPKIYSYKETKYTDIPEKERPQIPEFLTKRGTNIDNLYYCVTVMEFVKFPTLRDVWCETINQDPKSAINFLKIWLKKQLDMIRYAHIQPNDCHLGNILSNLPEDFVFIDYGFYGRFTLIDEIAETDFDYGYKMDQKTKTVHKVNIQTNEVTELTKRDHIKLNDHDVEMILLDILRYELSRSIYPCVHTALYLLFPDKFVDIFKSAMTELRLSSYFQHEVVCGLINGRINRNVVYTIANWLGGGNRHYVPIHRILTFKALHPDEYLELEKKWTEKMKELKKINTDDFHTYVTNPENKISKIERHLAQCYYRDYDPWREQANLYSYVVNHFTVVDTLYRNEFTNRFSNDNLKVGSQLRWENLISSTTKLDYALTFCDNWAGSGSNEPNSKNYVFKYTKVKAALIRRTPCDFTTYEMSYNHNKPEDTNWMNSDTVFKIRVTNEYIIDPNAKFEVIKLTPNIKAVANFEDQSKEVTYTLVELKTIHSSYG